MFEKELGKIMDVMPYGDETIDDELYRELMTETRRPKPLRLITGDLSHQRAAQYHQEDEELHDHE